MINKIFFLLILNFTSVVYANEEIINALNSGNHLKIKEIEEKAEKNPNLQLYLGNIYSEGKVVKQDYSKSLFWSEKALSNQKKEAYYNLYKIYFYGLGVNKDIKKAIYYMDRIYFYFYDYDMTYNIAVLYYEGKEVEKDLKKSFEYLKKSTIKPHKEASYLLGNFYYHGLVLKDDFLAFLNFKDAALLENEKAQYNLAVMYYNDEGYIGKNGIFEAYKWWFYLSLKGDQKSKEKINSLKNDLLMYGEEVNKAKEEAQKMYLKYLKKPVQ